MLSESDARCVTAGKDRRMKSGPRLWHPQSEHPGANNEVYGPEEIAHAAAEARLLSFLTSASPRECDETLRAVALKIVKIFGFWCPSVRWLENLLAGIEALDDEGIRKALLDERFRMRDHYYHMIPMLVEVARDVIRLHRLARRDRCPRGAVDFIAREALATLDSGMWAFNHPRDYAMWYAGNRYGDLQEGPHLFERDAERIPVACYDQIGALIPVPQGRTPADSRAGDDSASDAPTPEKGD
jgi:hypothetical protein